MCTNEEKVFEENWKEWSEKEELNYNKETKKYLKKGYIHFDYKFWFPDKKEELKTLLKKKSRAFNPFLKILIKTPRYKYQEDIEKYCLETKIRPICFASHIDNLIFSFYAFVLTKKYEAYIEKEGFNNCPIAYRTNLNGKCNIQLAKEVF